MRENQTYLQKKRLEWIHKLAKEYGEPDLVPCSRCSTKPNVRSSSHNWYDCPYCRESVLLAGEEFYKWHGTQKEMEEPAEAKAVMAWLWNIYHANKYREDHDIPYSDHMNDYYQYSKCETNIGERPKYLFSNEFLQALKNKNFPPKEPEFKDSEDAEMEEKEIGLQEKVNVAINLGRRSLSPPEVLKCTCGDIPHFGSSTIWCRICEHPNYSKGIGAVYGNHRLKASRHGKVKLEETKSSIAATTQLWLWNSYILRKKGEKDYPWKELEKCSTQKEVDDVLNGTTDKDTTIVEGEKTNLRLKDKPLIITKCRRSATCRLICPIYFYSHKDAKEEVIKHCGADCWNDMFPELAVKEERPSIQFTKNPFGQAVEKLDVMPEEEKKKTIEDASAVMAEMHKKEEGEKDMAQTTLKKSNLIKSTTRGVGSSVPMMEVLKTNVNLAQERIEHGVAVATADEAKELLMEQVKRLLGDAFPDGFYDTPIGKTVLDMAACFLVQSAVSMFPDVPGGDLVQEGSLLAMEAVARDGVQPLIRTGKELITGLASDFAKRGIGAGKEEDAAE